MINLFWTNLITFRYPIIINILLFIFYFSIASLTPYAADDFRYKLNPLDNEFSIQIFTDILNFQIWHYFNWGGRIVAHFLLQLFLVPSKYIFNLFNAIVQVLLINTIFFFAYNRIPTRYKDASALLLINLFLFLGFYKYSGMSLYMTSSFNYTGFSAKDLHKPLKDYGSIDRLLKESEEQVVSHQVPGKFNGQIIVTPDCLDDFVSTVMDFVTDIPLISGRSVYKDKLNESIADSRFTMHSKPRSDELQSNYFITGDGYESQDCTLIENGILKTFLLGIYGANKTGLSRSVNDGGAHIVDSGNVAFNDLVKSMKKGVILSRFSGGNPSDNGDFSGVAKNSYYVENGEVKFPISETMISGNICSMMNNIVDISKERINFGDCIYPWIQFDGLTIS